MCILGTRVITTKRLFFCARAGGGGGYVRSFPPLEYETERQRLNNV